MEVFYIKKLINNPSLMIKLVIISIICSIVTLFWDFGITSLDYLLDIIWNVIISIVLQDGSLITLIYFCIIIGKKEIKLKRINTILLIGYLIEIVAMLPNIIAEIKYYYIAPYFSYYTVLYLIYPILNLLSLILLSIFLGITFYSKKKSIIKPNLMSIIIIIVYLTTVACNIIIYCKYIIPMSILIYNIIRWFYIVPTTLYFRLYALNIKNRKD